MAAHGADPLLVGALLAVVRVHLVHLKKKNWSQKTTPIQKLRKFSATAEQMFYLLLANSALFEVRVHWIETIFPRCQ